MPGATAARSLSVLHSLIDDIRSRGPALATFTAMAGTRHVARAALRIPVSGRPPSRARRAVRRSAASGQMAAPGDAGLASHFFPSQEELRSGVNWVSEHKASAAAVAVAVGCAAVWLTSRRGDGKRRDKLGKSGRRYRDGSGGDGGGRGDGMRRSVSWKDDGGDVLAEVVGTGARPRGESMSTLTSSGTDDSASGKHARSIGPSSGSSQPRGIGIAAHAGARPASARGGGAEDGAPSTAPMPHTRAPKRRSCAASDSSSEATDDGSRLGSGLLAPTPQESPEPGSVAASPPDTSGGLLGRVTSSPMLMPRPASEQRVRGAGALSPSQEVNEFDEDDEDESPKWGWFVGNLGGTTPPVAAFAGLSDSEESKQGAVVSTSTR